MNHETRREYEFDNIPQHDLAERERLDDLRAEYGGQIVALEGAVRRLQNALWIVAAIADERGNRLSPYYPAVLGEDAQAEMGLLPGDLPQFKEAQP